MVNQKTRLHITPLSPDLLSIVLPSTIAHLAENISYHTLQTFPENNYGYLELPPMEAEKLKKKLNGSILKGQKIRVEEARPRKRALEDNEVDARHEPTEISSNKRKRPKRGERGPATIDGHELSPDRKVKRGWTQPKKANLQKSAKGSSDQAASKYTDKEEVLFHTKLPPNRANAAKYLSKKDKSNSRNVLVHEFEKSTIQPSFLREAGALDARKSAEYVDGKGWVDENGEIVEGEPRRLQKRENRRAAKESRNGEVVEGERNRTKKQTTEETGKAVSQAESIPLENHSEPDDETTSAGSSSDSEFSLSASSSQPDASKPTSAEESETPNTPTPSVHPLEAIFKRPTKAASADIAKPSLELQTSFSFFEPEPERDATTSMPDTPFNSQELSSRKLRSAAPTPDTAAPSRFNSWGSRAGTAAESDDGDDGEEGMAMQAGPETTPSKTAGAQRQQSEFATFFWENRGENTRAWKRRAREVKKGKRQRENRQRSRRF